MRFDYAGFSVAQGRNAADKRFDENCRFRLVVTITKGDAKGRILQRMVGVIGWGTFQKAMDAQREYLELAKVIPGEFASYGMIAVIDERDGCVHCVEHIG